MAECFGGLALHLAGVMSGTIPCSGVFVTEDAQGEDSSWSAGTDLGRGRSALGGRGSLGLGGRLDGGLDAVLRASGMALMAGCGGGPHGGCLGGYLYGMRRPCIVMDHNVAIATERIFSLPTGTPTDVLFWWLMLQAPAGTLYDLSLLLLEEGRSSKGKRKRET